jgi:hypothetical protein
MRAVIARLKWPLSCALRECGLLTIARAGLVTPFILELLGCHAPPVRVMTSRGNSKAAIQEVARGPRQHSLSANPRLDDVMNPEPFRIHGVVGANGTARRHLWQGVLRGQRYRVSRWQASNRMAEFQSLRRGP